MPARTRTGCPGDRSRQPSAGANSSLRSYGKCLDVQGGNTVNGAKVILWPCTGGPNQNWTLRADGTLRHARSGRCLDIPFGDTTNGNQLNIWDCSTTAAHQRWRW